MPYSQAGNDDEDREAVEQHRAEQQAAERPGEVEPDVLLDVPALRVEELHLEVEDLRAQVSLQAEIRDLLRLSVGADVSLGRADLELKGVEAQAFLKVRLDHVAEIIERVLTSIDRNPEIVLGLTREARGVLRDAGVDDALRGGVGELGEAAARSVQAGSEVVSDAATAAEQAGPAATGEADPAGPADRPAGAPMDRPAEPADRPAESADRPAEPAAERPEPADTDAPGQSAAVAEEPAPATDEQAADQRPPRRPAETARRARYRSATGRRLGDPARRDRPRQRRRHER
ncbi:hypothetical protein [Saccharopolyspora gregorii]|uniref:Uncharacterized protein n=1 Tax=Saccharopolyspora gregorii TaxID=33914 RepID=A0ABP6RZH7_9PSEU|nr:hypothetical protein [Saccharopolyspora gregorii]